MGETGLDYFRDRGGRDRQRKLFEAQLDLAAELGKPVVIHTRDGGRGHGRRPRRLRRHRRHALLLVARAPAEGGRPRLLRLLRRQRDLSEGRRPSRGSRAGPSRADPGRDGQPLSRAPSAPRSSERAGERRPDGRGARESAGRATPTSSRRRSTRTRPQRSHFREAPVSPKRDLGQHFLVDENILGVIGRLADLGADDVVLEVGPGLGVLTAISPSGSPGCTQSSSIARSRRPSATACRPQQRRAPLRRRHAARSRSLEPTKFVSNLPYNVATPLIVESLDRLPSVVHWTVMVQREVADRLFAAAADEGIRRRLGPGPARDRANWVPSGRTDGVPTAAERRLRARRLSADRAPG